jgi:hypothetical protein
MLSFNALTCPPRYGGVIGKKVFREKQNNERIDHEKESCVGRY